MVSVSRVTATPSMPIGSAALVAPDDGGAMFARATAGNRSRASASAATWKGCCGYRAGVAIGHTPGPPSGPRIRFVQVQDRPGYRGPRGPLGQVEVIGHRGHPTPGDRGRRVLVGGVGGAVLLVEAGEHLALEVVGRTPHPTAEGVVEARVGARPALADDALAEAPGRLDKRGVVEQHQRRLRRVRPGPLGGALLAGRGVERLEHRV